MVLDLGKSLFAKAVEESLCVAIRSCSSMDFSCGLGLLLDCVEIFHQFMMKDLHESNLNFFLLSILCSYLVNNLSQG